MKYMKDQPYGIEKDTITWSQLYISAFLKMIINDFSFNVQQHWCARGGEACPKNQAMIMTSP